MNINLKTAVSIFFILMGIFHLSAQKNLYTLDFKKGEVLDILLLSNNPDNGALFERYKKTVFPIGLQYSYKSMPGFAIKNTIQGSDQANTFIFGKWDSLKKREAFLDAIVPAVPDFHEQRKAIWSYFALAYYQIPDNTTFTIDRSKYNVVTSYWIKNKNVKQIINNQKTYITNNGGKQILLLQNGKTPKGYEYDPTVTIITQWESQEAFEKSQNNLDKLLLKGIKNTHQFVLK